MIPFVFAVYTKYRRGMDKVSGRLTGRPFAVGLQGGLVAEQDIRRQRGFPLRVGEEAIFEGHDRTVHKTVRGHINDLEEREQIGFPDGDVCQGTCLAESEDLGCGAGRDAGGG